MSDKESADSDLSLPKATVQKIISEILPQLPPSHSNGSDMAFSKSARDLLIACCMEFLRMLSSEANEVSEKESKKTIAVEHVEAALTDLGFEDYIEGIRRDLETFKSLEGRRKDRGQKMKTFGGMKASEAELAEIQARLFGEAKSNMEGGSAT